MYFLRKIRIMEWVRQKESVKKKISSCNRNFWNHCLRDIPIAFWISQYTVFKTDK